MGPVSPHTMTTMQASTNALVLPVQCVTAVADRSSSRATRLCLVRAMRLLADGLHYSAVGEEGVSCSFWVSVLGLSIVFSQEGKRRTETKIATKNRDQKPRLKTENRKLRPKTQKRKTPKRTPLLPPHRNPRTG